MGHRNVKNIRIVKRLLDKPDGGWTRCGLGQAAGCSAQRVMELLGKLEQSGLVQGTNKNDMIAFARYGADAFSESLKVVNCLHRVPLKLLKSVGERHAVTTTYADIGLPWKNIKERNRKKISPPPFGGGQMGECRTERSWHIHHQ